jgi:hypothetical protein
MEKVETHKAALAEAQARFKRAVLDRNRARRPIDFEDATQRMKVAKHDIARHALPTGRSHLLSGERARVFEGPARTPSLRSSFTPYRTGCVYPASGPFVGRRAAVRHADKKRRPRANLREGK